MPDYRIVLARSAIRELSRVPNPTKDRVTLAIEHLADEPRPRGVEKLSGHNSLYRIRVGHYRIIYQIDDSKRVIDTVRIRTRGAAYRL